MQTDIHFWSHLAHFFLEWKIFRTKVVEKIKTHILCSVVFFRNSYRLWDNVEKYCVAGQTTQDNMAHAHCMLDTLGYKHALSWRVILTAVPMQQSLASQCYLTSHCPSLLLFSIIFNGIFRCGNDANCGYPPLLRIMGGKINELFLSGIRNCILSSWAGYNRPLISSLTRLFSSAARNIGNMRYEDRPASLFSGEHVLSQGIYVVGSR